MHLRCPHCQNPIELADVPSAGEITCAGCGSSFQLDNFATATFEGPDTQRIGKFEVLGTLGHGAFGTVVKARDTELDRIVAIKIPRAGNVGAGSHDIDRFLREARSVAQLRFPSIITIHEVGIDKGTPYLVCDFVEGITLADLLTGRRPTFHESAKLIAEVADALQYAHSLGVVHRDVKPSNIMIRPDGAPCVMDFGLAKRDAGEITMTIDGQILGTPAYMSPEQARGDAHKVDGRSDVHSMGVILYQLLTGELPFRGNKAMLLHQVLHDEPLRPRTLNDKIPRDLETIALKAMAKEPSRRYTNAKEMADDLRRWLKGEPIQARPIGALERTWRWCKRKPALASANAAILVALLTFATAFFLVRASLDQEQIERGKAEILAEEKQRLADQEQEQRIKAEKLAEANKLLALQKEKARLDAEERRKNAEILAAKAKFDHAFQQPEDNRAFSILSSADLLRDVATLGNEPLQASLRLHLGNWLGQTHRLMEVLAHDGQIHNLLVSPNGKFALAHAAGKARLWEIATGRVIIPTVLYQRSVADPVFTPDSTILLTVGLDAVQRWDTTTGKPLEPAMQHPQTTVISAMAVSPDGKTVLTGSRDATAQLWETVTGMKVGPALKHKRGVNAVAFSPDSKTVLTGSDDNTAQLWEAATGKPAGTPMTHFSAVEAAAFSPNGKTLMTMNFNRTAVHLWETSTAKLIGKSLEHPLESVRSVIFSADGKSVLTVTKYRMRWWETTTGKPIGPPVEPLAPGTDYINAVAVSPDGTLVLAGVGNVFRATGEARLWELATGKPVGPPLLHQERVLAVDFSPDGRTVLTSSGDHTARLWDVATSLPLGPPLHHQGWVGAARFSPDGLHVLTGSDDKSVRVWQIAAGAPVGPPLPHPSHVTAAAFSRDSKFVLTGSFAGTGQLWETATGKPVGPVLHHMKSDKDLVGSPINAVAISPDGKTLLTGGQDNAVRFWQTATDKPIGSPLRHESGFGFIAFSADGRLLFTGGGSDVRLWDAATGKLLNTLPYGPHGVLGPDKKAVLTGNLGKKMAVSPDGKTVLTGSLDKTARLWDAATGQLLRSMQHQNVVGSVAFSPDGKTMLTGSEDKTARRWETATGQPLGPPLRLQHFVVAVAFDPDGKSVLTADAHGVARLWEAATGKPLGPSLRHQRGVGVAAFSPNGKIVVTGSEDSTARLWRVPQLIKGDPERILLLGQVITGTELDARGDLRVLDANEWRQRRQRLQEFGGPPVE